MARNPRLGFVFPGQGSQAVGMLADFAESHPVVRTTFEAANDALGEDLWSVVREGPEDRLNRTDYTQPAMLAAGVACWRAWREAGGALPARLAGHSLGEYTALVCAGALAFEEAVPLVRDRARFMQEAVPQGAGAMAAILGLDDDAVREVCLKAAEGEVVEAVNFNAPGQVVIAGNATAVARAIEAAGTAGAKRAMELPVSVPSHCALMHPASERLATRLADTPFTAPEIPVIHNVDVGEAEAPEAIRERLVEQLHSPVRWVETINAMKAAGIERLVECGPGKVLTGLNRRIDRRMPISPVFDAHSLQKALTE